MLKKLTKKDIFLDIPDKLFFPVNSKKEKAKKAHPIYPFIFHPESKKLIEKVIQSPEIYRHFMITGNEGLGKITSILALLKEIAPNSSIIYDSFPTIQSIFGFFKNEYISGNLVKATNGYLILPIYRLGLETSNIYELIRSALFMNKIQFSHLPDSTSIDPLYPDISLNLRVILVGENYLVNSLQKKDPDILEVFPLKVELDSQADFNSNNAHLFSKLLDSFYKKEYPLPDKTAKKRILLESLRTNESKTKFSTNIAEIKSIHDEACLLFKGQNLYTETDVEVAIENIENRRTLSKKLYYDDLKNGVYNIVLKGNRVGRVNALSIVTNPALEMEFGQINVISSRAMIGNGSIYNIEREVNLSGDIHDKGMYILQSYLKSQFSHLNSFGIDASVMFEQNHNIIDGDSAMIAELISILSALSGIPIPADIAITGAMSQHGDILPVGAINLKLEAWYSISNLLGDSKSVYTAYIPESNVKDILLTKEISQKIEEGKFRICSFKLVDDILPIVMDTPIGKIESDGKYTPKSIFRKIEDRLDKKKEPEQSPT